MSRKQKKYHFIYKTVNVLTGRYYYGMHSTDNLDDDYLGSGKRLRYSVRKYGGNNHKREIIEFCKDRKSLIQREMEIVNLNEIAKEKCMNLRIGGQGFIEGEQHKIAIIGNKALRIKLKDDDFRKSFKKKVSEGVKRTFDNGRERIFNYDWTGKIHTEETKQKMSDSHKGIGLGESNSQYGTCWIIRNEENKKINKKELNKYLKEGWIKGRKM